MLVCYLDMQVLNLLINSFLLSAVVHQKTFPELRQACQACILADIQALHQPLPLPVLWDECKSGVKLVSNTADLHGLSLIDHLTRMFRPHAHQTLKYLAPAGAKQSVDPQHLTLLQVHADIIQQPSAACLREVQVLDFQNLFRVIQIHRPLEAMILGILADHVFHNPAEFDVLHVRVSHIFPVPQDGHVITDLHDLLKPVGNVYNGQPLGQQFPHNLKEHLHFRRAQGGSGLVHDQHPQIVFHQVSGNFHHLLLSDPQVAHQRFRRNLMFQMLQHLLRAFYVLLIVQKQPLFLFMAHENILIYRHVREEAQLLVDDTDSPRPGRNGILEYHLLPVHVHLAGRRLFNPRDHFHQRAFSGAVFTDQHVDLSLQQVKGDLVQGFGAGIDFVDFLTVEHDIGIIKHRAPPLLDRQGHGRYGNILAGGGHAAGQRNGFSLDAFVDGQRFNNLRMHLLIDCLAILAPFRLVCEAAESLHGLEVPQHGTAVYAPQLNSEGILPFIPLGLNRNTVLLSLGL